ncbi:MAG: DNA-directed RNA polymerase specialized sigma24 family protein, partial [Pseudohongiellaceae bacterium]
MPSTAEIVEREAVRRLVVDAALELDESSRAVILLRYYENLPPRTIAKRLELPVETVRTRLKRSVAKLGRTLDQRHGGEPRSWLPALAPLAFTGSIRTGGLAQL